MEDANDAFLGYAGVMARPDPDHPLDPHHEIGWRCLHRTDNHRSQAVMNRLELRRRADLDISLSPCGGKPLSALVWDLEPGRYRSARLI